MKPKKKLMILLAFIAPISLSGCFDVSTRISTIGMKGYYGVVGNLDSQDVDFKLQEFQVANKSPGAWKMKWNTYVPYIDIQPGKEIGIIHGRINGGSKNETYRSVGFSGGVWAQGTLNGSIDGQCIELSYDHMAGPSDMQGKYVLRGNHRNWYGYPAQAMLIVAVPVDLVWNIIKLPVYLIFG